MAVMAGGNISDPLPSFAVFSPSHPKSLHSVVSVLCSLCGAGIDDLSGNLYIDRQRRAFLCRLCGCRRARLSGKEPAAGGARRFGRACLTMLAMGTAF